MPMVLPVQACAIAAAVIAAVYLPFMPGGHDPLAAPLAAIAWALGRVGLLLVPVGGLWLWVLARRASRSGPPPVWLVRVTLGACVFIALVTTLVAFASSNSQAFAIVTAVFLGRQIVRLNRRIRAASQVGPSGASGASEISGMSETSGTSGMSRTRMAAAVVAAAPIIVLAAQTMMLDAAATSARNRAIENGAPLIAEIERYRERRGAYPESLFAIFGDYKPNVVGIERYHYEKSGDAYNVIFKEPAPGFGARRFVVYNPRDRQRVTVHETDRLLLDDAGLDADNAGYTIIQPLPQPHWKVFLFLS